MLTLDREIIKISRVGQQTARQLKKLGLNTVKDLLFYFPFRYDDFSQVMTINQARPGQRVNIVGQIELIQNRRSPRRRIYITEALINDQTAGIKVIWFNQPFLARNLKSGDWVSLSGKVEDDFGGLVMKSPAYEKLYDNGRQSGPMAANTIHTQGLVPNYHLSANLTQKQIRFLIKQVIGLVADLKDWLPDSVRADLGLLKLGQAVQGIHFPKNQPDLDRCRQRLAFNELFLIQLQSQLIKLELKTGRAPALVFQEQATKDFVASLPFRLTNAQRRAAWEILTDLKQDRPMSRLLEGDVGSGKTIVALIAIYNVALNSQQSVLMVPTEILAQQHFDSISRLLAGTDISIGLLTRGARKINQTTDNSNIISKKQILGMVKKGEIDLIIGTHVLIQEQLEFKNLALAVIDEQHRFGVEQRKALINKTAPGPAGKVVPHLLSMTATPIPRSLALALYGDLDLSIIDEMPKERKKILTYVVPEAKRAGAYQFIRREIRAGQQVFVICPLIDFSDQLGVKSVKEEFNKLDRLVFPEFKMAFLHGRMKTKEKEEIMAGFLNGRIKILVSTTVVEVGVDVPNATIMMIEGAERFGLAQLHQIRGRVGRSGQQSYCFLFSDSEQDYSLERLQALVKHDNGFALAKIDLKFRGPGEVYGIRQKGFPELKIATLDDYRLTKQARDQAERLLKLDPNLNSWPELKARLADWQQQTHLE